MDITRTETAARGRYRTRLSGDGPGAELIYRIDRAGRIILIHTEVPEAFAGRRVGLALITRAVEDARAAGRRIIAECPYAAAQFRKHPEWGDVLSE